MADTLLGQDILLRDNDIQISPNQDFSIITGIRNLKQAINNRLQTYLGEYFIQTYGSELYKCIGRPADRLLLNRIKGYIFESLLQEPRIDTIESIEVSFNDEIRTRIILNISLVITPIGSQNELNLIFPNFVIE